MDESPRIHTNDYTHLPIEVQRIFLQMRRFGMTQADLATEITEAGQDCSESFVSLIKKGTRTAPPWFIKTAYMVLGMPSLTD